MELLAAHQRDLNCLSDESRQTRRRALERLAPLASPHPHPSLLSFWTQALCAPTLKLFSDPVEKCRELAICLATEVVRTVPAAAAHTLPPLMPVLLSRLVPSSAAPDEASEEIRLLLLQLTELAVQACGEASGEQAAPLVQVLCACLSDAFPEAKKAGCALILKVTAVMPEPIVPHCATLAAALQPCLTHQHSRVRALATEALVALLILEPSPLVEMVPQLALITTDRAPSVREQAVHSIAELLARMPQRRVHAARLLPLLLCALSDELEAIQARAQEALRTLGDLLAADKGNQPTLTADLQVAAEAAKGDSSHEEALASQAAAAAAAACIGTRETPPLLEGSPFAEAPHPAAAALVASEMQQLLPPLLKELADWTAKTRLRASHTLLGTLWLAGPAATSHFDVLLPPFLRGVEDDDEMVRQSVRRCICVVGCKCEPSVYLPLTLAQLSPAAPSDADSGVVGRRGLCLSVLGALMSGVPPDALRSHLPQLAATVAHPTFCVPTSSADEEGRSAYTSTQMRLCAFIHQLVSRSGRLCAEQPQKGFASQQQALEVLSQLADEAGLSSEGLHAAHLPLLLQQLLAAETEWSVHSSEWHLLQALLRQCGGDVAACQLLSLAPLFAKLLDPKRDPLLRGTVLGLLRQLLDTPSFVDSAELCEWAEHLYAAMLLPNLVWRAGKAAEHVRLAAMTCLSKLVRSDVLTPQQLGGHCEALPVLSGCLDDDNTETRRLGCLTLEGVLSKLGPSPLSHDQMRALYPELLKRLDDANDQVRVVACSPISALFCAVRYSNTYESEANLDRTNYQYLLRGLLVHLDDPSPQIQAAVMSLLQQAMRIDPPVFSAEARDVRERHRTTNLCDQLIEQAQALFDGQLV